MSCPDAESCLVVEGGLAAEEPDCLGFLHLSQYRPPMNLPRQYCHHLLSRWMSVARLVVV